LQRSVVDYLVDQENYEKTPPLKNIIKSIKPLPHSLEIKWSDRTTQRMAYLWLRDNCPSTRHNSGQKIATTLDLPLEVTPHSITLKENELIISWDQGNTVSYYPFSWLLGYKKKASQIEYAGQVWWNRSLDIRQCTFDYQQIRHNSRILKEWLETVSAYGFALLVNVPTKKKQVLEIVSMFGYVRETNYGKVFDVVKTDSPTNLWYTNRDITPSTDNPYRDPVPTLHLLHCIQSSKSGGEVILVDGYFISEKLKKQNALYFDQLINTPVKFRYQDDDNDLQAVTYIIGVDRLENVQYVRFNSRSIQPFELPLARQRPFYEAYQAFEKLINSSHHQLCFKFKEGMVLLADNERILHGRRSYPDDDYRFEQGCYAERDGLSSKLNILKKQDHM